MPGGHGHSDLDTEGLPFICPWRDALHQLSKAELHSLAGNGIHSAVMGHVLVCVLAIAEPVHGAYEDVNPYFAGGACLRGARLGV